MDETPNGAGPQPAADATPAPDPMAALASAFAADDDATEEIEAPATEPTEIAGDDDEAEVEETTETAGDDELPYEMPESEAAAYRALPEPARAVIREGLRAAEQHAMAAARAQYDAQLTAERQQIEQLRAYHMQALQHFVSAAPQPPPAELAEQDPIEYTQQFAKYQSNLQAHHAAQAQARQLQEVEAHEARTRMEAYATTEGGKLRRLLPDLADPKKGPALIAKLEQFASSNGINRQALSRASAAEVVLLDKARRWDEAQRGALKLAKTAQVVPPKAARPGNIQGNVAAKHQRIETLKSKTAKSGSVRDLAALYQEVDF